MQKELYLSSSNIEEETNRFLERLQNEGFVKNREYDLSMPALLVLDMQVFFLSPQSKAYVASAPAIMDKINLLINIFESLNLPIVYTKHSNNSSNAKMMSKRWKQLLDIENNYYNINNQVHIADGSIIIEKTQYDAFYQTDLDDILNSNSTKELIITGVLTNLCVETTARSGFVRGFLPIVPIDATATYNSLLHYYSLANICYSLFETKITKDIIERMNKLF